MGPEDPAVGPAVITTYPRRGEYDDGIFSGLEGEDRDVVFAVARTLREARRSAAVLVWAPRAERGVKALLRAADEVIWHYDDRPATMAHRKRRPKQMTITQGSDKIQWPVQHHEW